jgi:CBS domain containing-hemolysin-like protein
VLLLINPQATTVLAIGILFLLILSFVLSGSEVAFFSLTHKDINILKTKQDTSWRRIVTLLEEPKILLASLLIANSIINISIIILSNFLIDEMVVQNSHVLIVILLKIILVGFVIILFGKVMPKAWATQNNLQFAYYTSGVVELVFLLFRRVGSWAVHRSDRLERFFGRRKSAFNLEKLASAEEKNILQSFIEFKSITVKQIMRTRLEVYGIEYPLNFAELKQKVEELHYSRLPVYRSSLDVWLG